MRIKMLQMLTLIVVGVTMGISCLAQDRSGSTAVTDRYLISANAGKVNFVEGDVTVLKKDGHSGPLLRRDSIEIGDVVSTGSAGKAEVLLNPGSFLRLGSNSKFSFRTTDLNDLQIALTSGSAIFEVLATDDFTVSVFTPKESLTLVATGVYRVDLLGDGTGTLSVVEGKAEVGDYPPTLVTKGRATSLGTSNTTLAKFDRGKRDELAQWSQTRGKEIVKTSASLYNQGMKNALASSFMGGRWNVYNSFGLWVYDPFSAGYCFLSFGSGLNSPYGYGYGWGLGWYGFPSYYYLPPTYTPTSKPVDPTRVAVAPVGERPSDPITRQKPAQEGSKFAGPPPFTQLERHRGDVSGGGKMSDPFGSSRDSSGSFNNTPSYSSPSSSAPVYVQQSAPAPVVSAPPVTRDVKPIDH